MKMFKMFILVLILCLFATEAQANGRARAVARGGHGRSAGALLNRGFAAARHGIHRARFAFNRVFVRQAFYGGRSFAFGSYGTGFSGCGVGTGYAQGLGYGCASAASYTASAPPVTYAAPGPCVQTFAAPVLYAVPAYSYGFAAYPAFGYGHGYGFGFHGGFRHGHHFGFRGRF